jgi:hypothetical protein
MALSIQQMRTTATRNEVYATLANLLTMLGFDVAGWQEGRIQKALLLSFATFVADGTELVKTLADAQFNDYASGDLLEEYSKSRFSNPRFPALRTIGRMTLVSKSTSAYVLQPGQVLVASINGIEYRNVATGDEYPLTLPAGGTISPMFQAVMEGAAGNEPAASITKLVTSLAGVTVQGNPSAKDV